MASHIISSVSGSDSDVVLIKTALLSVSDKTGLVEFAKALSARNIVLLSTGGTAKTLRDAGLTVTDVSEHTGSPEIMDGRVKTLHPKVRESERELLVASRAPVRFAPGHLPTPPPPPRQIHGGLLGVRGNASHESDMVTHGIAPIDLVVVNLYAFDATVAKGSDFATCIENIDIGGPSMLRSAAKNHAAVTVASSPNQYDEILAALALTNGGTPRSLRTKLAAAAYALTAGYDGSISSWFASQTGGGEVAVRSYARDTTLKYGCNPHQSPAWVGHLSGSAAPFAVLNGTPGYINFLDAANAWQLVRELKAATGLPAAASFKHVSPAGAAVAVPLSPEDAAAYDVPNAEKLTPLAVAYIRARNADPMCSYGDFAAVSEVRS